MVMDRQQRQALDRHITGNYGEDQFKDPWPDDEDPPGAYANKCQVSDCTNKSEDGVLCSGHIAQMEAWESSTDEEGDDVPETR